MITLELINGFALGIEHISDEELDINWMIVIHLGILRLAFISHAED